MIEEGDFRIRLFLALVNLMLESKLIMSRIQQIY